MLHTSSGPDPAIVPSERATPWLTLVGIGEDGVSGLAPRAVEALSRAPLVIGGKRHLSLATPLIRGAVLAWSSPIEDTYPAIVARRGTPTCVLASGDPFHYGIGTALVRLVGADAIACLPHSSAFSLAAARLGWPLQDCLCVSLHGRALERIIPALQPGVRVLALSWDGGTPAQLAALLCDRGFGPSVMTVCESMGGSSERCRAARAETFDLHDVADLNTIAVELRATPAARIRPCTPGLPDDWFEHDGQITKAPIRAVTLSALAPRPGELLWDVGAGSGSVGIEWLLAHPAMRAVAIEPRFDRMARIGRNAAHWGVSDRLQQALGEAPAALRELPYPDAVFLGGGATAPGQIEACCAALRPGGRLVVNAVTIETQQRLMAAMSRDGGELLTMSVAQAEPVGGFHGFRPAMPVMQWRWVKP